MRARLRLRFSPSRAKTDDCLRLRQNLFFGRELAENLGLVGYSEAAAHKNLKSSLGLAVHFLYLGKVAHVMHHDQATCFGFATGEGRLELLAEVLHIVMAEQELGVGFGVGRGVKRLRFGRYRPGR